ncbi:DMT family transporter [bacterium SCSIO 12741]|nr:DMT family transporter [bacterium SCSIO 12741]
MKIWLIYGMAFSGGVFLAIQAGFNAQLGSLLKQPVAAVVVTSLVSVVGGLVYLLAGNRMEWSTFPIATIPWYLWFLGGLFSLTGISLYFYTIPQLGISRMITFGLCGQLLFSLAAGNWGWLNLPAEPLNPIKIAGAIALLLGIILINWK